MIAVINSCLKYDFHIVHVLCSLFQRFVQCQNEIPERRRAWLILSRRSVIRIAHLGIPIFLGTSHPRRGRTILAGRFYTVKTQ